jgi:hypothetical protein
MSVFVVNSCLLKGCLYWRLNDQCAKHGMPVQATIERTSQLHTAESCQVRQQMNEFRLTHMLEN